MNLDHHLILASNSPRRQELLKAAGFDFSVFTRDFPEDFPEDMEAEQVAEFLANQKNKNYREVLNDEVIITADTTVIFQNSVLNKPQDRDEAFRMLRSLSGNTHEVVCGVCVSDIKQSISFSERTEVTFLEISDEEIDYYVENYKPFDKAGAYGIQEWLGLTKISEIKGSFYNVMGLPVHRLFHILNHGFNIHPVNLKTT